MFKIIANPTFQSTVRLSVPGSDAGSPLRLTWRHKTARDLDAWLRRAREFESEAAMLAEVIEDWTGVFGPDDKPLPFSPTALAQLLDQYPAAGKELLLHYNHQLADARAKNS